MLFSIGYSVPTVSNSQCTHYYLTNVDHSGISLLLINKHRLSLKSDPPLEVPICWILTKLC